MTARFTDRVTGEPVGEVRGDILIGADGIHSVFRKQFFPNEGPPVYKGINMWRGVTRWKPFLDGNTFVRIGWHKPAKVLIYPIRDRIDAEGRQLINWVCDIEQEQPVPPGGVPHPASLKPQLRNDHLQYAMTWYGLALTLVGVFGFWARSRLRDKSSA